MNDAQFDETLAPGIRRFVERPVRQYARFPDRGNASLEERRRVAAEAHGVFGDVGSSMARTWDVGFDTPVGPVLVRVHMPVVEGPLPALAYAHSGPWLMFSVDPHDRILREYAVRAQVAVVRYSPPPEAHGQQADEFLELVRWLQRGGLDGVMAECIVLGGDSGGAHLVLATALRLREDLSAAKIKALLLNYGAFDAEDNIGEIRKVANPLSDPEIRRSQTAHLNDRCDFHAAVAVPFNTSNGPLAGLPPILLSIAERDALSDDSLGLARTLRQAGVDATSQVYPGRSCNFLRAVPPASVSNQALNDAAGWLRFHLTHRPDRS